MHKSLSELLLKRTSKPITLRQLGGNFGDLKFFQNEVAVRSGNIVNTFAKAKDFQK